MFLCQVEKRRGCTRFFGKGGTTDQGCYADGGLSEKSGGINFLSILSFANDVTKRDPRELEKSGGPADITAAIEKGEGQAEGLRGDRWRLILMRASIKRQGKEVNSTDSFMQE